MKTPWMSEDDYRNANTHVRTVFHSWALWVLIAILLVAGFIGGMS